MNTGVMGPVNYTDIDDIAHETPLIRNFLVKGNRLGLTIQDILDVLNAEDQAHAQELLFYDPTLEKLRTKITSGRMTGNFRVGLKKWQLEQRWAKEKEKVDKTDEE